MDDRWFRLGDHGRYPPHKMNRQFSLRMLVAIVSAAAILAAFEANFHAFSAILGNPATIFFPACITLVLTLFWAKHYLLNRHTRIHATVTFSLLIAFFIPVLWLVSPDWNNPHVYPIANYVGLPIAVLTVPAASFYSYVFANDKPTYSIRDVAELILVPVWFVIWMFVELFVFGWVWI